MSSAICFNLDQSKILSFGDRIIYISLFQVYFIWVTGSQRHFEWLLDILQEVEEIDEKGMVAIDIFITKFFQNFDLRTAMLVSIILFD